jgi:hypothetical protein
LIAQTLNKKYWSIGKKRLKGDRFQLDEVKKSAGCAYEIILNGMDYSFK